MGYPKNNSKNIKNQKGFAVLALTFFTLVIMLSLALSMSSLIFFRQKISTNSVKSTQSYYTAEAGIEDALLRLNNNPNLSASTYNLAIGTSSATIAIPDTIGGSRTIVAKGDSSGIQRKIETVYSMHGEGVAFNYGAQVGPGGLIMNNGSRVEGNVVSNGNITGSGIITNNVVVSGNGNRIEGPRVNGNVLSYTCRMSIVDGNLTYVTGGTNTCKVGGKTQTQSTSIPAAPLPISQTQIDTWKADALAGGTSGGVTVNGIQSLGPKKINGNLTIGNGATLKVTGTLHITGDINLSNNATIKLDVSYGLAGGVVVSDGKITLSNNSVALGSGQSGSNMMMISTNSGDGAITISNNGNGGIFYTSSGGISLSNNSQVKEITGYKITLQNNAVISYETGMANAFFSNGPSGGWEVTSWEEK